MFPTLAGAASTLVQRALERSNDKLVRVDCGTEIGLEALIAAVDSDGEFRIGLTSPLSAPRNNRSKRLTDNPRQITKWRNEPIAKRREAPLIILGRASGREEAGLRRCPAVISEQDILRSYKKTGGDWLNDHTEHREAPRRLFTAIVDMALEGLLGLQELEAFCTHSFNPPDQAHLRPQKALWRLGLIPDDRAMDGERPGVRLSVNYDLRESLVSAPSSNGEERRRDRLTSAAEAGNPIARAAIAFAATRRSEHLKDVELTSLLKILEHREGTDVDASSQRAGGLLEALETTEVSDKLGSVGENWSAEDYEFSESIELNGKKFTISLEREARGEVDDLAEESEEEEAKEKAADAEALYWIRIDGADLAESQPYTAANLIADAVTLDHLAGTGTSCRDLAQAFTEARRAVAPLRHWGKHLLEVLILAPAEREHIEAYVARWETLANFVLNLADPAHSGQLRQRLSHLDAVWDYRRNEEVLECVEGRLLPIHPFVLAPHLEIAQYAIANIGKPNLSDQLRWALDRSVPAYPAIWVSDRTLLHRSGSLWEPEFAVKTRVARPPVNTPTGIVDLVRAYVGINPYATRGMNILLVDPPEGSGIPNAIRQLRKMSATKRVNVTTVLWHGETLPWEPGSLDATNLGRIQDLPSWVADQKSSYNVILVFGRPRAAHAGGSHPGFGGPSRGLQNALTVTVMPAPMLQPGVNAGDQVPCVSIQPRESHDVVQLLMRLGRWSDRDDRFFEVRPLLQGSEVEEWASFGRLCDWLAFAAPSPIGLIPPLSLGAGSLTFLGREELGSYALFVYARDLYAIRKKLVSALKSAPIAPNAADVERQLEKLALAVPNGVLRIGRGGTNIVNTQIGLIVASHLASQMQ